MKTKIILTTILIILSLLVLQGCPDALYPTTTTTTTIAKMPEIDITTDTINIISGDTTVDFGTDLNPISKTFTITNNGDATLDLIGNPIVDLSGDAQFTVDPTPDTNIPAKGQSNFTITFTAGGTSGDTHSSTVIIKNNDVDEADFNFKIIGKDPMS